MEEAERVADEITIIDHGKIVAEGTADRCGRERERARWKMRSSPSPGGTCAGRSGTDGPDADDAPRLARPLMRAIWILWRRQIKRYSRARSRMIGALGQPLLFLFGLGFGFGPIYARAGGGDYLVVRGAWHRRDGDHF